MIEPVYVEVSGEFMSREYAARKLEEVAHRVRRGDWQCSSPIDADVFVTIMAGETNDR